VHIDRPTIERLLPHRHPVGLLEHATVQVPGDKGEALARLPGTVPMLTDRDAGDWNQELCLEAAAQTLGVVLGTGMQADKGPGQHLLLGFDHVEFSGLVPAADAYLLVQVQREEGGSGACTASFEVRTASDAHTVAAGRVMVLGAA
jgi:predicted hotdog family 3-hydroxylacyl-ACP dehydratase